MWTRLTPCDVTLRTRWRQRSERIEPRTYSADASVDHTSITPKQVNARRRHPATIPELRSATVLSSDPALESVPGRYAGRATTSACPDRSSRRADRRRRLDRVASPFLLDSTHDRLRTGLVHTPGRRAPERGYRARHRVRDGTHPYLLRARLFARVSRRCLARAAADPALRGAMW
jgi:hypothetical protein